MSAPAFVRRAADGQRFDLHKVCSTIGRSEADIVLSLTAISRGHAEIERKPHGYMIRDLASRNGTFVNGTRIGSAPVPLRDGDEIVLAGVEVLTFVDPQGTPVAPAIGRPYGVWIDPESQQVWVDAQPMEPPLSARQQSLLELLDSQADAIVSRQEIIETVWADVAIDGVSSESVDSLLKRLKARLRPLQLNQDYLEVHRGRGVRLRRND